MKIPFTSCKRNFNVFHLILAFLFVFQILQRIRKQNSYNKNRRLINNEGMTTMKQRTKKKQFRAAKKHLNSNIKYPDFAWTDVGSEEYLNAIDDINDVYRKMRKDVTLKMV